MNRKGSRLSVSAVALSAAVGLVVSGVGHTAVADTPADHVVQAVSDAVESASSVSTSDKGLSWDLPNPATDAGDLVSIATPLIPSSVKIGDTTIPVVPVNDLSSKTPSNAGVTIPNITSDAALDEKNLDETAKKIVDELNKGAAPELKKALEDISGGALTVDGVKNLLSNAAGQAAVVGDNAAERINALRSLSDNSSDGNDTSTALNRSVTLLPASNGDGMTVRANTDDNKDVLNSLKDIDADKDSTANKLGANDDLSSAVNKLLSGKGEKIGDRANSSLLKDASATSPTDLLSQIGSTISDFIKKIVDTFVPGLVNNSSSAATTTPAAQSPAPSSPAQSTSSDADKLNDALKDLDVNSLDTDKGPGGLVLSLSQWAADVLKDSDNNATTSTSAAPSSSATTSATPTSAVTTEVKPAAAGDANATSESAAPSEKNESTEETTSQAEPESDAAEPTSTNDKDSDSSDDEKKATAGKPVESDQTTEVTPEAQPASKTTVAAAPAAPTQGEQDNQPVAYTAADNGRLPVTGFGAQLWVAGALALSFAGLATFAYARNRRMK